MFLKYVVSINIITKQQHYLINKSDLVQYKANTFLQDLKYLNTQVSFCVNITH